MLILIATGGMGGYSASVKLSQKVRFIEEYLEFIKIVENEIRYNGNYLSEIINKHKGDSVFYLYINKCHEYIVESQPFPIAWKNAFSDIKNELSISNELENIINNFGIKLGASDIDGQISHCQYNYELALPYLKSAIEERRAYGKLYSILGICTGTVIALFFV